jgi:hypothetical protein
LRPLSQQAQRPHPSSTQRRRAEIMQWCVLLQLPATVEGAPGASSTDASRAAAHLGLDVSVDDAVGVRVAHPLERLVHGRLRAVQERRCRSTSDGCGRPPAPHTHTRGQRGAARRTGGKRRCGPGHARGCPVPPHLDRRKLPGSWVAVQMLLEVTGQLLHYKVQGAAVPQHILQPAGRRGRTAKPSRR